MSTGFQLGGRVYQTKQAVQDYAKTLKLTVGERHVVGSSGHAFLLDLIKLGHPDADTKIGCGIQSFLVEKDYAGITRFTIIRKDNSRIDFSYLKCIKYLGVQNVSDISKREAQHKLQSACRHAVTSQIREFTRQHPNALCELCGSPAEHVDHENPTFADLLTAFNTNRRDIPTLFDDIPFEDMSQRMPKQTFRSEDRGYQYDFERYHQVHAQLRMLCAKCNLGRKK